MSTPQITVDTTNGVPPWRQIHDQIDRIAGTSLLPVGSRLPPIRQLAGDLGIAVSTVARAYRALEAAGVTHTARRRGTVVARRIGSAPDPLHIAAADYVTRARELGVGLHTALDTVRALYLEHTT